MPDLIPKSQIVQKIVDQPSSQRQKGVEVVGPWGSGKALVAAQTAQETGASLLYITSGRIEAESAFEDLCTFTDPDQCVLFPAWEVLPTDTMSPADDIVAERMNALDALMLASMNKTPVFVSVSVRSLLQQVVDKTHLEKDRVYLNLGDEHDLEDLSNQFIEMGYDRELMVEQRGEFSIRGGILDIFPISSELPFRVEFFGDEVESIRRFEPETQRSIAEEKSIQILPRSEKKLLTEQASIKDKLSVITDYFDSNTVVAIDEPLAVLDEASKLEAQFGDSPFMAPYDRVMGRIKPDLKLSLAQVAHAPEEGTARITVPMLSMIGWSGKTDDFWEQLEEWEMNGYSVRIFCNNTGERRRLMEILREKGYSPGRGAFDINLGIGRLRAGFSSELDRFAILSEREMFGRKYVRRVRRRFQAGTSITQFSDVTPGDYIVHIEHGIGRYLGLRRFKEKANDFMAIQYSSGDVMYVPVTHVDQVQKYVGGGGAVPKIDKIGGASWNKAKKKVKKAVQDMTEELLKLYARRETLEKQAFSADTHFQHEFEDSFEYEETPDQLRAIIEIKQDMESIKPMERLLCGDVGYGKTEVAMRAAFKAVMGGKQVGIMAPTTVLAEQHFETFTERFADYPVKIDMLSRFRSGQEIRDVIKKLRLGELDIVIGTHRLTSGDVQFKDLGLVILDEEQKFGVKHKEKLKKLKADVDVLSLSATPIPRTLHLSMSGVRDMSVINTAPNDRLPIHTCIEVYNEQLIAEAISREIGREGQIFYLHNRVKTIDKVAAMVKKLVPNARVAIGHGQMNEHELEDVMAGFVRHDFDVLVCTTIIGSGLDIPNANTIVVDRADMFGLAELYQIRGRVGRYKHRAFAYLLIPGDRALTEEAQLRLKALEEFSTLGSGFRIAMRDLEIRGCGNLLGSQQSGNIATVGYETYCQLIEETVAEMKGTPIKTRILPTFDITTDAFIPDDYIGIESHKITLYKRITSLQTEEDISEMRDELQDRFGKPPAPIIRLLDIMRARVLAAEAGATKLTAAKNMLTIRFLSDRFFQGEAASQIQHRYEDQVKLSLGDSPAIQFTLEKGADPVAQTIELFQHVVDGEE
jgi:transcription-repair coupling factor (superfamily II helicase)